MVGAAFDAAACKLHFASGATARNAFGARIMCMLFLVLCHDIFAPGQDKGSHKLDCACLATYVQSCVRRQTRKQRKGARSQPSCHLLGC